MNKSPRRRPGALFFRKDEVSLDEPHTGVFAREIESPTLDACPPAVTRQRCAVAPYQQLFLLLTPALDLSLAPEGVLLRAVQLGVNDANRTALSRVAASASLVVRLLACRQV